MNGHNRSIELPRGNAHSARSGRSPIEIVLPVAWFTIAGWFVWGSGNTSEEVLGPIPSTPEVAASQIDTLHHSGGRNDFIHDCGRDRNRRRSGDVFLVT